MQPINRTHMAKRHAGKWIALKTDRKTVVGTGKNVHAALAAAQRKGVEHPIITRMPKDTPPRSLQGGV